MFVQSNTLLLADLLENFRNMCLVIYKVDPASFLTAPGLVWQAAFKKTKIKLDLLTDINMLLMVGKGIRGGMCPAIYRYAKANNKYMKDYNSNKELSYLKYWDVNNSYGWAMSQKLPVNDLKKIEEASAFNEDFIKNYNDESDGGYFVEVDAQYPENLHNLHNDLPFLPERMKIEKFGKLVANLHDKTDMLTTNSIIIEGDRTLILFLSAY